MTLPPPPAELAHLADALGAEALFKLIEAHGGARLYVAQVPRDGSDLVALLGAEAAAKLAATWGGDYLKVPLARAWFARCLKARGFSQGMIARHMRTTENTVRLLLNGGPDTRQMGLPL